MRVMTKWALLLGLSALSLWAVGLQPTVTNELYPWIADNGVVTWQELYDPRRTDLFQPSAALPVVDPLRIANVGVRAIVPANPAPRIVTIPNAARPQVSADGQWLVYYQEDKTTTPPTAQVYVLDLTDPNATPKRISYKGWSDTDDDGVRDGNPAPSMTAILPAISGSGRIVAFLSRDPDLNDPQGDGNGPSAQAPPLGRWLIYIHDRDADGNGTLDEAKVGGTTTRFLPDQTGNTPLFVTLTEVRLSLDQTGRSLAFSTWTGTQWRLWFVPDVQNPSPTLIATSLSPLSIPCVAGSRLAFTASGPFSSSFPNDGPGIYVVDTTTVPPVPIIRIQTNGVNGAPALSRDGTLLAFHSTMTGFRVKVNGGQWQPWQTLPNKRNAVDDVFVFDLTGLPVWSTLVLRQANPAQFPPYAPCVNPALPSSSANLIAFQEIVNGVSRVRVVNLPNTVLR